MLSYLGFHTQLLEWNVLTVPGNIAASVLSTGAIYHLHQLTENQSIRPDYMCEDVKKKIERQFVR